MDVIEILLLDYISIKRQVYLVTLRVRLKCLVFKSTE